MPKSKIQRTPTFLSQGNAALRQKNYIAAMSFYLQAAKKNPGLGKVIAGNIHLTQQKYQQTRASLSRPHLAVFGLDNPERILALAQLHQAFAKVEIIVTGFTQPVAGQIDKIFSQAGIPAHSLIVENRSRFLEQAQELVGAHPFDVVHLANPSAPNILIGLLYKLIWGTKVVVDIDDENLIATSREQPLNIEDYFEAHAKLPEMTFLKDDQWARLSVELAKEFDGLTVSSQEIQKQFGGKLFYENTNRDEQHQFYAYGERQGLSKYQERLAHAFGGALESSLLQERIKPSHIEAYKPAGIFDLGLAEHVVFTLHPISQLVRDEAYINQWHSQGDDPHFILDPQDVTVLEAGWRRIDLMVHKRKKHGVAKFYFDTGAGFNELETITLPYKSGEHAQRIIYLDKSVANIRFDPKESSGCFRIERLAIEAISTEAAREGMLQALSSRDPTFEGMTSGAIFEAIVEGNSSQNSQEMLLLKRYMEVFVHRPGAIAYEEWIDLVESNNSPSPQYLRQRLAEMPLQPLISVVMPVYNAPEIHLRACIDSVLAQSYPNWELCIADDASPKEYIKRVLKEYEQKDARVRVVYRAQNGHISLASNSALEIALGKYVALLDHDDALPEHALYFIAEAINENPDAQILYSDEDKIDEQGRRFEPHFKSDWNPDLFFSQNYVSHLGVYQRRILQTIGGFRTGVEGSQDQDLLLRCLPHVQAINIIHIPRVLYHWRTVEGSTALASGEKSYTTDAGIKALQDYFAANSREAISVERGLVPNTYRVRWPIPQPAPLVSLLIPTRDRKAITEVAVRSILEMTAYQNYEIIILDNGSVEPETLEFFAKIQQEDSRVSVLRYDHPFNYSAINNFGVAHVKGEIIGLVNNDVEVISPEWLTEMVGHCCRKEIGCVGAKLYYGNDTLQHGGVIMSLGGVAGHSHKYFERTNPGYFHRLVLTQNLSGVTAACLLIRREIYNEVGGLDEVNLKVAFNDVDFCLKVRQAGYRNLWSPYVELYHHESISRGNEDTPEKVERFRQEVEFMKDKWGDALKYDPYYSPNLTKDREDFSLGV